MSLVSVSAGLGVIWDPPPSSPTLVCLLVVRCSSLGERGMIEIGVIEVVKQVERQVGVGFCFGDLEVSSNYVEIQMPI